MQDDKHLRLKMLFLVKKISTKKYHDKMLKLTLHKRIQMPFHL